ncbi:MAG: hypothetical protein KDN22_23110 [Verrucomicrobiae bacterium]|nr:hypothetical protein [Verrucomicrobiae bacterium]
MFVRWFPLFFSVTLGLLLSSGYSTAQAQLPLLDSSFKGPMGFRGWIESLDDGRFYTGFARYLSNGTLDPSFSPPNLEGGLKFLRPTLEGKVVVAGDFSRIADSDNVSIVRLNQDGSFDPSFDGGKFDQDPTCLAVMPDGKIFVSGFNAYRGVAVTSNYLRILQNGQIDTTFNRSALKTQPLLRIALPQPDGKIVLAGEQLFYNISGDSTGRAGVVRLMPNGAVDRTFKGIPADKVHVAGITGVAIEPAGNVWVAGSFRDAVTLEAAWRVLKLSPAGTLLARFARSDFPDSSLDSGGMYLRNGFEALYLGSEYVQLSSNSENIVARVPLSSSPYAVTTLEAGGTSILTSDREGLHRFQLDGNVPDLPEAVFDHDTISVTESDAKIWIPVRRLASARTEELSLVWSTEDIEATSGSDYVFDPLPHSIPADSELVWVGLTAPKDSKTEETERLRLNVRARMGSESHLQSIVVAINDSGANPDGSEDVGFHPTAAIEARDVKAAGSGRFWIGGSGEPSDLGMIDTGGRGVLNVKIKTNGIVHRLAVASDGKVYFGGKFNSVNGMTRNGLARMTADGQLDLGYSPELPASVRSVTAIHAQQDGSVLVGAETTFPNAVLFKLLPSGARDLSFLSPEVTDPQLLQGAISAILSFPDGRIAVGGNFSTYAGYRRNCLAVLNADGTLYHPFYTGALGGTIDSLLLDRKGKLLAGGNFRTYEGNHVPGLLRFLPDGRIDDSFRPEIRSGEFHALTLLQDGSIVAAGGWDGGAILRITDSGRVDFTFASSPWYLGNALALDEAAGRIVMGSVSRDNGTPYPLVSLRLSAKPALQIVSNHRGLVRVTEAAAEVKIYFWRKASPAPLTIPFTLQAATALEGSDYRELINGKLEFDPLVTESSISISLIGDNVPEPEEEFIIQLDPSTCTLQALDGTGAETAVRVRIIDDDSAESAPPSVRFIGQTPGDWETIRTLSRAPDGTIWSGGVAVGPFGSRHPGIRKFDSSLNMIDFQPHEFGPSLGGAVIEDIVAGDNYAWLGGTFASYGDNGASHITRILSNGTHDPSFHPGVGTDYTIRNILPTSDGGAYVVGSFSSYAEQSAFHIVRISRDGSVNEAVQGNLNSGRQEITSGNEVTLASDGSLLLPYRFENNRTALAKLDQNGVLDPGFGASYFQEGGWIGTVWERGDGRLIVSGAFQSVDNVPLVNAAAFTSDGLLDQSFSPTGLLPPGGWFTKFHNLTDGSVLAATNQPTTNLLTKFLADGSIDQTFFVPSFGSQINDILALDDSTLLLGGLLFDENGKRSLLAVLNLSNSSSASAWRDIFNQWLEQSATASGVVVDDMARQLHSDVDSDGVNTLEEFLADSNPFDRNDRSEARWISETAGLLLEFVQRSDIDVIVEISNDLAPDGWELLPTSSVLRTATGIAVDLTAHVAENRELFVRRKLD